MNLQKKIQELVREGEELTDIMARITEATKDHSKRIKEIEGILFGEQKVEKEQATEAIAVKKKKHKKHATHLSGEVYPFDHERVERARFYVTQLRERGLSFDSIVDKLGTNHQTLRLLLRGDKKGYKKQVLDTIIDGAPVLLAS